MTKLQRRLGKAVRRLREGAEHSQEGFATLVGVHRTTMGRIERGDFNVTLRTLERIAKALGIGVSALVSEAETEGKSEPRSDRAQER